MESIVKRKVLPNLQAIGKRIRQIRGFERTQAEFGKQLGVGQQQFSKYEKGQSAPTLEFLLKLKAVSGKSLDWIVCGDDEASTKSS